MVTPWSFRWPQAGELRDRVTIETPDREKNGYGEAEEDEDVYGSLYSDVPARVRQIGESLVAVDGQVQRRVIWEVTIRWATGIPADADLRVVYGSHNLYATGVDDIEGRQRWIVLTCEERAGSAADEG